MRLRIRHKDGIATLTNLTSHSTLLDLHTEIAKELNCAVSKLELKTGYPPKPLPIDSSNASLTLDSLAIRDGEQILTSERLEGSTSDFDFSSTSVKKAAPALASSNNAAGHAFAANQVSGAAGFGSRPAVLTEGAQSRTSAGQPFGGLSTIDTSYKSVPASTVAAPSSPLAVNDSIDFIRVRDQGLLVVRILQLDLGLECSRSSQRAYNPNRNLPHPQEVADDNSCLFNAIAYTVDPSMKTDVKGLRQIVAQAIQANPDIYPDVVLGGRTVQPSGTDYDAVALSPGLDIPAECDQTQFDVRSEEIVNAGTQLAAKLKKAHKYTDLATFTLRCAICQTGLKGEKDAQRHAQQTTHTTFEEYV
ncbi:ubiquitin-specific protease otu1 [Mortierella sp. GBA30]|nr:ubiquitin-specific protease otu1 [Mortierella sp. GBA30]